MPVRLKGVSGISIAMYHYVKSLGDEQPIEPDPDGVLRYKGNSYDYIHTKIHC
jgi:hypothetical protein